MKVRGKRLDLLKLMQLPETDDCLMLIAEVDDSSVRVGVCPITKDEWMISDITPKMKRVIDGWFREKGL